MDVHKHERRPRRAAFKDPKPALGTRGLDAALVGQRLGEWQPSELRLARSFAECRGLGGAQLEDLYQETTLALLDRDYNDEEHLQNALRWGIKHRALHLHRDERRREEILTQRAPELQLAADGRAEEHTPEQAAILAQDRLIVAEFLSELTTLEREVFWLAAEGMRYRAIAPVLQIPVNVARKACRVCEQKRARFQLLYDTGRMCGYRSHTIETLKQGGRVTDDLMLSAYAHLHSCAQCRSEHKTNARRVRRSFQGQAAALLPIPILTGRLGWLSHTATRARTVVHRLSPYGTTPGGGEMRERAVAMLASGGVGAKVAAGAASVVVIAGGTLGATHVLHESPSRRRPHAPTTRHGHRADTAPPALAVGAASSIRAATPPRQAGRTAPRAHGEEQTGFGFLGVPGGGARGATDAHAAASHPQSSSAPVKEPHGETRVAGGPFSP